MNHPNLRAARAPRLAPLAGLATLVATCGTAHAQLAFSIDWKGQSNGRIDSVQGLRTTESDILMPGPGAPAINPFLPAPQVVLTGQELGIQDYVNCTNPQPGVDCGIELDCFSGGIDAQFLPVGFASVERGKLWFSTDEWAVGSIASTAPPDVRTQAAVADSSADIWCDLGLPIGPLGPGAAVSGHSGVFDGNGARSGSGHVNYGLGLIEVNPPLPGVPNLGDNIDALDIGTLVNGTFPAGGLYYSLDSAFIDPLEGVANSGSAAAAGFVGGDVVFQATQGGGTTFYASALLLGLDAAGPDTDDLDALILAENGVGGFQPSAVAYDWVGGATDMLLFSVRRGSAVVGAPDSRFGAPIEPGDILTMPLSIPNGGNGNGNPSIFIAAEVIGLATARTDGVLFGDDLSAMDKTKPRETCYDCNNNGVEDSVDIALGHSNDKNLDGIPDECQDIFAFCPGDGTQGACPCGNESGLNGGAGCENSTGGGATLGWTGTSSVTSDDLSLTVTGARGGQPGLFVQGATTTGIPFKDGFFCLGNPTERLEVAFTDPAGAVASSVSIVTEGNVSMGDERFYQFWYRDPVVSPCGTGSNFTSAIRVPWN